MRKLAAPLAAALLAVALVAGCSSGSTSSSSSASSSPTTAASGSGAVHEACALVERVVTLLFSGGVSALAPEAGGLQEELERLRTQVPAELRDDVDTARSEGQEYLDLLARLSGDPSALLDPDVQQQMADAGERLSNGPAAQAIANIEAWARQNCTGMGG